MSSTAGPDGRFDTPLDGAIGLTGSIPVTGWAVDDVDVVRVRILRDPVEGEGPNQVFIGNAAFVDGARPDVAAANPGVPRPTRVGWGYLMLTNFLPDQGNGTFKLYAYADDADGHSTLLGTKTITCSNASATKPFGAIDTPGQGEIAAGLVDNFGWVLAHGAALAYPPFGTVSVLIDGVSAGSPAGWTSRPDLSSLFPAGTYSGVTNALGVWPLDTTTLSNGVHTIAWVVTTNDGQTDGIGSRYFTVSNGAALHTVLRSATSSLRAGPDVNAGTVDDTPMTGRHGYDPDTPLRMLMRDSNGRQTLRGEELDRFELQLGEATGCHSGWLRAGSELAPLPIGSRLDAWTGTFTWQPGAGFIGSYDLVFLCQSGMDAGRRRDVRIVLEPKGTRLGPHLVVDTPISSANGTQPFTVAGWALDADAAGGSGVEAIHVWAYPVTGESPIFLGAAAYGGLRPDVAAIFGARFEASGFGLVVRDLPPGIYDLAVFPWNTVTDAFGPATIVRITVR
jgi:hypothetical protein